jgi:hypothetical protein
MGAYLESLHRHYIKSARRYTICMNGRCAQGVVYIHRHYESGRWGYEGEEVALIQLEIARINLALC